MLKPEVSILMPVYNGEKFLRESIESIINQDFMNFEFLIINDGSIDSSEEIIKSFSDNRIIYVNNIENQGIVKTLNRGLKMAKGKYIARMDADDVSLTNRISEQYNFMEQYPEVMLCGTYAQAINSEGIKGRYILPQTEYEIIKIAQLFNNSFVHPTVMFRSELVKEFTYCLKHQYAEDYFLFTQVAHKYSVRNINEVLLYYREHDKNTSSIQLLKVRNSEKLVIEYQLEKVLTNVNEDVVKTQRSFVSNSTLEEYSLKEIEEHLNRIKLDNQETGIYNQAILNQFLHVKWFNLILNSKGRNNYLLLFLRSNLLSFNDLTFKQVRKLLKRNLKIT